jgi:hypothetical protein
MNLRHLEKLIMAAALNDAQKLDAILAAQSTPNPALVTALTTAITNAVTAALAPITAQLTTIAAGVADIQGEVDEPAAASSGSGSSSGAGKA